MPMHDWTRVEAGIFHAFHVAWIPEIQKSLNAGLLPQGYYALAEQHAGQTIPDVLTLHSSPTGDELSQAPTAGGTAVAEAPPKVRRHIRMEADSLRRRQRTLAIRHVSGHRLVALIELVSPGNKNRAQHLDEFVEKMLSALKAEIHVLVVDPFPPGRWDPHGIQGAIQERLDQSEPYDLPVNEPLTFASYVAGSQVEAYVEHVRVGAKLPEMPLFLSPDRYVNVPLEPTYMAAYGGMPTFWRDVLETPTTTELK